MGFKQGFFNVFGLQWMGTRSLEVFLKVPHSKFARVRKLSPYPAEYDKRWKQATIRADDNLGLKKLIPVLQLAYVSFVGRDGGVKARPEAWDRNSLECEKLWVLDPALLPLRATGSRWPATGPWANPIEPLNSWRHQRIRAPFTSLA